MKRKCLFICMCIMGLTLNAQNAGETIILKNGNKVQGTIVERVIGKTVKIETADGSVFIFEESEIAQIVHGNASPTTASPQTGQPRPADAEPADAEPATNSTSQTTSEEENLDGLPEGFVAHQNPVGGKYKLGDIYNRDGVKGIVVLVDADGEHGLLLSLKGTTKKYSEEDGIFNAGSQTDGMANTQAVYEYAKTHGGLDEFPLFEWCAGLGEGWYIPSYYELANIWVVINGGTTDFTQNNFYDFSKLIQKAKGDPFINRENAPYYMYSSTETSDNRTMGMMLRSNVGNSVGKALLGPFVSRAVQNKGTIVPFYGIKTWGGKLRGIQSRAVHRF